MLNHMTNEGLPTTWLGNDASVSATLSLSANLTGWGLRRHMADGETAVVSGVFFADATDNKSNRL